MKKVLLAVFAVCTISMSYAQNATDEVEILRDLADAERKALVSENMMLTDEESKIFWPLYDAYRAEAREIGTEGIKIIEEFAENYETMDDAKAIQIMDSYFKNRAAATKVQNDHRLKMQKMLPGKLVMRYMQIENKMNAIINFGLAAEIPLTIKE